MSVAQIRPPGNAGDALMFATAVLVPDAAVEVRALGLPGRDGGTWAGWFNDLDAMVGAIEQLDRRGAKGVYVTLNPVNRDLLARCKNRVRRAERDLMLTGDGDVLRRHWLPVDFDPERASGVSATDDEHRLALIRAEQAAAWLAARGWPEPIRADSGNGGHLVYSVHLPNDADAYQLVQKCLEAVAVRFGGDGVIVDTKVANAGRIWKVYGTVARKGENVPERPHRRSALIALPNDLQPVVRELLEALAAEAPQADRPQEHMGAGYGGAFDVDAFLGRHGLTARKAPWQGGWRWVLQCCPFSDAHTDGAYAVQLANGALAAGCQHHSCTWTWRDLRAKFDPGAKAGSSARRRQPQEPAPQSASGLPIIVVNDRHLRDVTRDALEALLAGNDPPQVFQRGSALVRLRVDPADAPFLEAMSDDAVRNRLARTADWLRAGEKAMQLVPPPMDIVRDLLALPQWPLPVLNAIVETPIFARNGSLITAVGYNPPARLWLRRPEGFELPPVPTAPTSADIAEAKRLLTEEVLGDFPFADEPSRAHALAAMLLPFLRAMIDGPTPLHVLDKPSPGTGASLLADAITTVATGRPAEIMTQSDSEEEWRKRITAQLMRAPTFLLIDNLRRRLDSGTVSAAITARMWTDRQLGFSRTVIIPVTTVWIATGNNVVLSNEIARRCVLVRLDAKVDQPWLRTGFRHADLHHWIRQNRGQLVWAALVLGQAWIAAGQPEPNVVALGMFENWTRVVGGVLETAGIRGFLGNATRMYVQADEEGRMWRAFVAAWSDKHREQPVLTKDLYDLAVEEDLLGPILGDKGDRSQRSNLGRALNRLRDRVVGAHQIEVLDEADHKGRAYYRLVPVPQGSGPDPARSAPTCGVAGAEVGAKSAGKSAAKNPYQTRVSAEGADLCRLFPGSTRGADTEPDARVQNTAPGTVGATSGYADEDAQRAPVVPTDRGGKKSAKSAHCPESVAAQGFEDAYFGADFPPTSEQVGASATQGIALSGQDHQHEGGLRRPGVPEPNAADPGARALVLGVVRDLVAEGIELRSPTVNSRVHLGLVVVSDILRDLRREGAIPMATGFVRPLREPGEHQ